MSILAASVSTRGGKALLSRQFLEISGENLQEMLSGLSELRQNSSLQHTTIENSKFRYIYEPLEDLYVVLITDLGSNILQDIKTLRLLAQCIKSQVPEIDERHIVEEAFSIIDAFDEVVSMGLSENLTLSQVETFLQMESHEEKIQEIIERNKQLEAAEERKKKAKLLEAQRKMSHGPRMGFPDASPYSRMETPIMPSFTQPTPVPTFEQPSLSRFSEKKAAAPKGKGLKLGKVKQSRDAVPLLADLEPVPSHATPASKPSSQPQAIDRGTEVVISENIHVEMSRDGSVRSSRAEGKLTLFAGDREHSRLRIKVSGSGASNSKPHPKMDRSLFSSSGVLGLKNAQEEFPANNVLLVKWNVDNVEVPIKFSCWVSEASDPGFVNVTLEYEVVESACSGQLQNVTVAVPLPTSNAHVLDPSSNFEQFDDQIIWTIPSAGPGETAAGSFEFTAEADSEDDFYPIRVAFGVVDSDESFGHLDVDEVIEIPSESPLDFSKAIEARSDNYIIS